MLFFTTRRAPLCAAAGDNYTEEGLLKLLYNYTCQSRGWRQEFQSTKPWRQSATKLVNKSNWSELILVEYCNSNLCSSTNVTITLNEFYSRGLGVTLCFMTKDDNLQDLATGNKDRLPRPAGIMGMSRATCCDSVNYAWRWQTFLC